MADKMLKIELKKSLIGRGAKQIATAEALGLKKPGDVTVQPDNAATQGKIAKIGFLLSVTEAGSLAIAGANAATLAGHRLVGALAGVQFMKLHCAYTPCY